MTVRDVIDINIHGSAFPGTYIGNGTLLGNSRYSDVARVVTGYFTSDGNAVDIPLGFEPQHVEFIDVTDVVIYDWQRGLPAGDTIKTVTAGTTTVDTGSVEVVSTFDGRSTVSLSAAAASTAKLWLYKIIG